MKNEIYSWRLSAGLKSDLEREARHRKVPIATVLETAVRQWLKRSHLDNPDDQIQYKLHTDAAPCLGTIAGRNPRRVETARQAIRERLKRRHGR